MVKQRSLEQHDEPQATGPTPLKGTVRQEEGEPGPPTAASLDELIEATQDAVVFIDQGSAIWRFNASAERMFGYSEAEVLGRDVSLLMPGPDAARHQTYMRRYEETGQARMIGSMRRVTAKRKSGELFPVELSVTRLDNGRVHYAAFLRDVSERDALLRRVAQAERLAVVGTTAAVFAHEVGNPLNNMSLYAQLLQRRFAKATLPDEAHEELDAIVSEIERLRRLLDEFRSVRRKEVLHLEPVDLGRLLHQICGAELGLRGDLTSEVTIERDVPFVVASEDKLTQIFVNLLRNAAEAMVERGHVAVTVARDGDWVLVEIGDTGPGLPNDFDVFHPFCSTKTTGSGLGLSVVRELVRAHGGSVEGRSLASGGAVFTVRLPVAGPTRPASLSPSP